MNTWLKLASPTLCLVVRALLPAQIPNAPAPTSGTAFVVATIKLAPQADPNTGSWSRPGTGQFTASHVSLARLMQLAYGIDSSQIANKPAWLETTLYDVQAKPENGIKLSREELKPLLQDLLHQRFHLIAHTEMRASRGYALIAAKDGTHLTPTKGDHFPGFRTNVSPRHMSGFNWSMPILATYLTSAVGFPVVDETGISGSYDVDFTYLPTDEESGAALNSTAETDLLPIPLALKRATGLTLTPRRVPVETIVIDSVDRIPTEN